GREVRTPQRTSGARARGPRPQRGARAVTGTRGAALDRSGRTLKREAMNELVRIITARDAEVRNRSLDAFARSLEAPALIEECDALDRFRRQSVNLYERVRAQFFLYA